MRKTGSSNFTVGDSGERNQKELMLKKLNGSMWEVSTVISMLMDLHITFYWLSKPKLVIISSDGNELR